MTPPELGRRGEGWFVAQLVLFVAVFAAGWAGPAWTGTERALSIVLGLIAILAGASLAGRAVADLGGNLSVFPRPVPNASLVEAGAFGLVRHPIYGGLILGGLGWALIMASPLALAAAVILGAFFDLKSRREELWLAEQFAAYTAYRQRTRRLIPFVY